MTETQIHTQLNIVTLTQTDDNVVSIYSGKHSKVKDNVVVTTLTPTATVTQSNVESQDYVNIISQQEILDKLI
jgi:hypothetical protein